MPLPSARRPLRVLLAVLLVAACSPPRHARAPQGAAPRPRPAINPAACLDHSPAASDSLFPPQPNGVIIPTYSVATALHGRRLTVNILVSAAGTVDSVDVVAPPHTDPTSLAELRRQMLRYTFEPAVTLQGCPVRAWFPIQLSFTR